MHDHPIGLLVIFGSLAVAAVFTVREGLRVRRAALAREDAHYEKQRDPMAVGEEIAADYGYGPDHPYNLYGPRPDPLAEPTPIHDALAAEAVIASADAVVREAWERAEGETP